MAAPPPPPLPDPPSTDPLPLPTSIPTTINPFPSSDLTSSSVHAPDLATSGAAAGPSSSVRPPPFLPPPPRRQRASSSSRSRSKCLSSSAAPSDRVSSRSEFPPLPPPASVLPPPVQQGEAGALPALQSAAAPLQPAQPALLSAAAQLSSQLYAAAPQPALALAGPLQSAEPTQSSFVAAPLSGPATSVPHRAAPHRSATSSIPSAAFPSDPSSSTTPSSAALQQQTYAQVARNSRGPGFVRAHASEVESFARLPRTGVNIICGNREGMPSFSFVNSELPKVEELYANALVMKFHGGRPSLEASHKEIQSWGIGHPFSIGPLSSRAYLLRFQDNVDLLKVLTRPSTLLITFPYKVYRWHNLCHMKVDSCLAPVWISLPRIPLQCFIPEFLESVANRIGRFLCFDKATSTLARPSAARICVEIDLRKAPPPFIWVGLHEGFKQQIIYERLPKYCNLCHVIGHVAEGCHKAGPLNNSFHVDQRVRPSATIHHNPSHQSTLQQVSKPVAAPPPPPQATHIPPTSAMTPPNEALIQVLQPATMMQRVLAAEAPPTTSPSSSTSQGQAPTLGPATLPITNPPPVVTSESVVISATAASQAQIQNLLISNQTSHPPLSSTSTPGGSTAPPSAQYLPKSPSALPQSDHRVCSPDVRQNAVICNTFPAVHLGYNQLIGTGGDASIVCRTDSLNQPPLQSIHSMPTPTDAVGTQSVCHNAAGSYQSANDCQKALNLSSAVSLASQVVDKQPGTSKNNQKSTTKSITLKPNDVGNSTSLTQQQTEALERFKNKVQEQARIQGKQLSSPYSVNHFEALLDDQSDEEDYVASYNSDTDDGCVEPIDMGYQSADGCSSNKHKGFAPSGMKTNKRHPNMPLNVRLRSRKSSYPSTP